MPATTLDPYATLGVPRGADERRLRDAYRRLSRQHHPDRSTDPGATERMQRINRAWEIVSDPVRRARYDAETRIARQPDAASHWASTMARRRAQWAPPPTTWSAQAASSRAYPPPPVTFDDGDGPSWRAIATVLLVAVLAGPFLIVALPTPFIGLAFLLIVGSLARSTR